MSESYVRCQLYLFLSINIKLLTFLVPFLVSCEIVLMTGNNITVSCTSREECYKYAPQFYPDIRV